MRYTKHHPKGASLQRIETLSSKVDARPDWMIHLRLIGNAGGIPIDAPAQDFSGELRDVSRRTDVEPWLEELLDQAAERLDQAHEEWLEVAVLHKQLEEVLGAASDFADLWAVDLRDCPDEDDLEALETLAKAIRAVGSMIARLPQ